MFFSKKKKEEKKEEKELEEIKESIASETLPGEEFLPEELRPKPGELEQVLPPKLEKEKKVPSHVKEEIEMGKEISGPKESKTTQPEKPKELPLFVKVEKYDEIIRNIEEIKILLSGIRQVFDILNELEIIRIDAIKIIRATIQRLEKTLLEMDSELLRPKGTRPEDIGVKDVETARIEDALTDLQKQLHALRQNLESLK